MIDIHFSNQLRNLWWFTTLSACRNTK